MTPSTPSMFTRRALKSRSISGENPSGHPGRGGMATEGTGASGSTRVGPGWKMNPCVILPGNAETSIADIEGSGILHHLWVAMQPEWWKRLILRFYWDGSSDASVAVPLGDFFGMPWDRFSVYSSAYTLTAPYCGLNSFVPMPFRTGARVTIENLADEDCTLFYSLDYGLGEVAADAMYLHATWNRSRPVAGGIHTLLDVAGRGAYVGTFLGVGLNGPGWWGEGEFKFFVDDDGEFATIVGTGTEDFFGGAWNFEMPGTGYTEYGSPKMGLHQVLRPDGLYESQARFSLYRWQDDDAVNFDSRLRVDVQNLGISSDGLFRIRQDDYQSTAFWYADVPQPSSSAAMTFDGMMVSSIPRRSMFWPG